MYTQGYQHSPTADQQFVLMLATERNLKDTDVSATCQGLDILLCRVNIHDRGWGFDDNRVLLIWIEVKRPLEFV